MDIAMDTERSVYDCLYLALAEREGCRFVTADRRLFNAVRESPIGRVLHWVGDPI